MSTQVQQTHFQAHGMAAHSEEKGVNLEFALSPVSVQRRGSFPSSPSSRGMPKVSSLTRDSQVFTSGSLGTGVFDISVDDGADVHLDEGSRSIRFLSAAAKVDALFGSPRVHQDEEFQEQSCRLSPTKAKTNKSISLLSERASAANPDMVAAKTNIARAKKASSVWEPVTPSNVPQGGVSRVKKLAALFEEEAEPFPLANKKPKAAKIVGAEDSGATFPTTKVKKLAALFETETITTSRAQSPLENGSKTGTHRRQASQHIQKTHHDSLILRTESDVPATSINVIPQVTPLDTSKISEGAVTNESKTNDEGNDRLSPRSSAFSPMKRLVLTSRSFGKALRPSKSFGAGISGTPLDDSATVSPKLPGAFFSPQGSRTPRTWGSGFTPSSLKKVLSNLPLGAAKQDGTQNISGDQEAPGQSAGIFLNADVPGRRQLSSQGPLKKLMQRLAD